MFIASSFFELAALQRSAMCFQLHAAPSGAESVTNESYKHVAPLEQRPRVLKRDF
jgi:hypothetical protein